MQRRILSFLGLAFGISWAVSALGVVFQVDVEHPAYIALAAAFMLGPALAALVQWKVIEREPWGTVGLHPSLVRWRRMAFTVLLGILIIPVALVVTMLIGDGMGVGPFGHAEISSQHFTIRLMVLLGQHGMKAGSTLTERLASLPGVVILGVLLLSAVVSAFTVNLPFMLGEELGWRGYLYSATTTWSPAQRIGLTGPVWGVWHAPLIAMGHNYPGYPIAGIVLMIVFCTLLAILFDHTRRRVNSVWGACVLHGIINGTAGAFGLFAWDGHVLVGSPAGMAGCIAIAVLAVVILLCDGEYRRAFFVRGSVPIVP